MRNHRSILGVIAAAGLVSCVMSAPVLSRRGADPVLQAEIEADGHARFYVEAGDARTPVWTIVCRVPLRGCVGRAEGIALTLDLNRAPRLIAATSPQARVSIDRTGRRRRSAPDMFARPLPPDLIRRLSHADAAVVIDEPDAGTVRYPTTGLDVAAAYLVWLGSPEARIGRDARLWPGAPRAGDYGGRIDRVP